MLQRPVIALDAVATSGVRVESAPTASNAARQPGRHDRLSRRQQPTRTRAPHERMNSHLVMGPVTAPVLRHALWSRSTSCSPANESPPSATHPCPVARDSPAATFPLPSRANQIADNDRQGRRPDGGCEEARLSRDGSHAFYYITLLASNAEWPARFGSSCSVLPPIPARASFPRMRACTHKDFKGAICPSHLPPGTRAGGRAIGCTRGSVAEPQVNEQVTAARSPGPPSAPRIRRSRSATPQGWRPERTSRSPP